MARGRPCQRCQARCRAPSRHRRRGGALRRPLAPPRRPQRVKEAAQTERRRPQAVCASLRCFATLARVALPCRARRARRRVCCRASGRGRSCRTQDRHQRAAAHKRCAALLAMQTAASQGRRLRRHGAR
eukprot:363169-Chlamydomonas_euryale.AAC.38